MALLALSRTFVLARLARRRPMGRLRARLARHLRSAGEVTQPPPAPGAPRIEGSDGTVEQT